MEIDFKTLQSVCRYLGSKLCGKPPNFAGYCTEDRCPLKEKDKKGYKNNQKEKND